MVESRIAQIEAMLKNVKLIDDDDLNTETVNLGSKVVLLDVEFNEKVTYQIVGSTEADPDENRISDESPMGKSLLGRALGEAVTVEAPGGNIEFKILEISK
jgi:transcription elongation factor GreA